MDKKSKHKALSVAKTVKSRQRRLDNKAKRAEIHAIDPDMKVRVINQVTHDEDGDVIKVENGKIKYVEPVLPPPIFGEDGHTIDYAKTVEVFDAEIEEVEAVEVDDVSRFQTLIKKWKL